MGKILKCITTVLVVGLLAFFGYMAFKNSPKEKKKAQDYQNIQTLADAVEKTLKNSEAKDFDEPVQNQWYQFDLSILYTVPDADGLYFRFDKELRKALGDNFPTKLLSTEEPFVISLQPALKKYEIHVGNTCNGNTMVYPYWEYKGLPKK